MPDMQMMPRAPLDAVVSHGANGAGLVVQDCDGTGLALVQVRKGAAADLAARVEAQFGVALPARPVRVRNGSVAFACTAPGVWFASQEGVSNAFAASLRQSLRGVASVTDQSDGYALLRLSGPSLQTVLSRMVPIDLHPRAFACGDVAASVVGHIGILLWRLDDAADGMPRFEIALFRSLVESFWHALSEAAAESGLAIAPR